MMTMAAHSPFPVAWKRCTSASTSSRDGMLGMAPE
jgi:hypothetical protein